jgi:cbb3-type cytochrome oxidase subunit 3
MVEWLSQYSGYAVLISFFVIFLGIAIWSYLPSRKAQIEKHKYIPLREDQHD